MRHALATLAGLGYLKGAPGTYGSLFALPCAALLHLVVGPIGLAIVTLAIFWIGWWSVNALADDGHGDPPEVVVDEFVGQCVAVIPISIAASMERLDLPRTIIATLVAFALFRLFDIRKPSLIGRADRMKSALGVMLDDLIAGLAAACFVIIVIVALHIVQ